MSSKIIEDRFASVEDEITSLEAGGFEAFRDEDAVDPYKARSVHNEAQWNNMSDVAYLKNEDRLNALYDEDERIGDIESTTSFTFDQELLKGIITDAENMYDTVQYYEEKNAGANYTEEDAIYDLKDGFESYFSDATGFLTVEEALEVLSKYEHDDRTPVCQKILQVLKTWAWSYNDLCDSLMAPNDRIVIPGGLDGELIESTLDDFYSGEDQLRESDDLLKEVEESFKVPV